MMTSFPPDSSAEAAFQCKKNKVEGIALKDQRERVGMYMNTKQRRRGRWRGRKHKERKCRREGDERETEEDIGEQNREEEHGLNIFHGHTVDHYFGFDYLVGRAWLILADNNSFLKSDWIKRWANNPFLKADWIKTAGGWFKSCCRGQNVGGKWPVICLQVKTRLRRVCVCVCVCVCLCVRVTICIVQLKDTTERERQVLNSLCQSKWSSGGLGFLLLSPSAVCEMGLL